MERLSVTELNRYVKLLFETNDVLRRVAVVGEISNFSVNRSSGHAYFSLKDDAALLRAVCFQRDIERLRFIPKDGMQVLASGRISLFERDGQYQLIVQDLQPLGIGRQNAFLDAVKQKLAAEGLFDPSRKRPIKQYPRAVAVITAAGSAALADILHVAKRKYPIVNITVFPVQVQGMQSESSIVGAIRAINEGGLLYDAVIIARGGGSAEDLFTFHSEAVVRAAALLKFPFVSAVGHETDFSLLDLAADLRAATPSLAAEYVFPDIGLIKARLSASRRACADLAKTLVLRRQVQMADAAKALCGCAALSVQKRKNTLASRRDGLLALAGQTVSAGRERLAKQAALLQTLSPLQTLTRGYGYIEKDGAAVISARSVSRGDLLKIHLADGSLDCSVQHASIRSTPDECLS